MTKRKRHPEEFKREAVRLLEERGDSPVKTSGQSLKSGSPIATLESARAA